MRDAGVEGYSNVFQSLQKNPKVLDCCIQAAQAVLQQKRDAQPARKEVKADVEPVLAEVDSLPGTDSQNPSEVAQHADEMAAVWSLYDIYKFCGPLGKSLSDAS